MKMTRMTLAAFAVGLAISAPVAHAQDGEGMGFGFHGIGGQLGFISPEDPIDSSFMFGVQANLGTFSRQVPQLLFVPSITYWSKSYDTGTRSDASISELGFSGDARWMFTKEGAAPDAVQFFGSAGIGFYRGKSEFTTEDIDTGFGIIEGESFEDTNTDIGLKIGGGAQKRFGEKLDGFAEVTFKIGDIDSFRICVGGTWDTSS